MLRRLAGWNRTAAIVVVLMALLAVVDLASKALAPWLSRVRESAVFRALAMLIAPPVSARSSAVWLWWLVVAALGAAALIGLGPEAAAFALMPAVVYQPSKAVRESQEKLVAVQQKIGDVFAAAGESLDFATSRVLELTGAKDSAGAVTKVREWNKEAEDLGKAHDHLRELDELGQKTRGALDEAERARKQPRQTLPLPGGGDALSTPKRLGTVIVGSEAFTAYRERKAPSACIEESYGLVELKALFETTAGWAPESARIPGLVIEKATRPVQVLDIIPTGRTGQASVVYMEETTRTHAAAERAEAAAYAESTFVLTEQSSTVRSIGDSIPVTDEQIEDVVGVESYLNQRLEFGVRQRLDNQVLNGNGTAPNLRGITNVAGIQTQAKGSDPVPDAIYKAMVKVRVTGRAFPGAFVVHPNDWQDVRLLRTADGIYIWGSPSEAGPERIWGIQVVQADSLTEGTGLVGDFANFCQLYERRGAEIMVGYVNDDFLKGKRTIRAGLRVAFVVYRAAAFATVTGI